MLLKFCPPFSHVSHFFSLSLSYVLRFAHSLSLFSCSSFSIFFVSHNAILWHFVVDTNLWNTVLHLGIGNSVNHSGIWNSIDAFFLPPVALAPCSPRCFLCKLNNSNSHNRLHCFSNHRPPVALAFKPCYRRCHRFLPSLIHSSLLKWLLWLLSPFSLADHDIQAIVEVYKDDPRNPKYVFKHLSFSVTDQQFRVKPAGVLDIMCTEAMGKLEGMESTDRERLWP